jgi:hypothetical protein
MMSDLATFSSDLLRIRSIADLAPNEADCRKSLVGHEFGIRLEARSAICASHDALTGCDKWADTRLEGMRGSTSRSAKWPPHLLDAQRLMRHDVR